MNLIRLKTHSGKIFSFQLGELYASDPSEAPRALRGRIGTGTVDRSRGGGSRSCSQHLGATSHNII